MPEVRCPYLRALRRLKPQLNFVVARLTTYVGDVGRQACCLKEGTVVVLANRSTEAIKMGPLAELCGFGGGAFAIGNDATDGA